MSYSGPLYDVSRSTVLSAEAEVLDDALGDTERSLGTNKIRVKAVPMEETIALAANLLASPGRYAFAMAKLSRLSPTTSPGTSPLINLQSFSK
ncbi:hypothetical protein Pmar_PMAR001933, partial [Perkinsus marinus ATCC 50983]